MLIHTHLCIAMALGTKLFFFFISCLSLSFIFLLSHAYELRYHTAQSVASTKSQIIAGNVDLQLYSVDGILCYPSCSSSNYYAEMNVTYIVVYTLPSQDFTGNN